MTIPPPPPSGKSIIYQPITTKLYQRRPQVWVPPVIIFGAFAAGYAIPWNLGPNPNAVILRLIVPLLISAFLCGIAGFYSYRTVSGWRVWTWIALASMTINGIQFVLYPALQMPALVTIIVWLSIFGLLTCGIFGQEKLSEIHQPPSISNPGFKA